MFFKRVYIALCLFKKNSKRESLYIKRSEDLAYESDYNWTLKKIYESKHRITSIFDFISKYGMIWSVFILLLPFMMTRGKFVKTQPTLPKITASLGRTQFSLKWVISWLGVILQTRGPMLSYRGLIKPSTSLS